MNIVNVDANLNTLVQFAHRVSKTSRIVNLVFSHVFKNQVVSAGFCPPPGWVTCSTTQYPNYCGTDYCNQATCRIMRPTMFRNWIATPDCAHNTNMEFCDYCVHVELTQSCPFC